jgi:hypothetical protein
MPIPYAKFRLPTGGNGLPAMLHKNKIAKSINEWAKPKHINIEYETEGYTLNVRFGNQEDLMMFKLSYTPLKDSFSTYEIFYF